MKKRVIATVLACVMGMGLLTGCGSTADSSTTNNSAATESKTEGTAAASNEDLSGTITFTIWDNNLNDFIESNDMVGKFQEKYPDIDIEIEKIKDDSEYWNAMKMRASANQLPDVMFNKTFTLARFKEYLLDLSDTEAAKNNELAAGYAIDGKILGIPMTSGYEYVYYWKDMFKEAGVEVPTTWGEFEDAAKTLQDYYGKDNANFMAIALVKGCQNPELAQLFVEYMISDETQSKVAEAMNEAPVNKNATMPDELKTYLAFGEDAMSSLKEFDETYISQAKEEWIDTFQRTVAVQ